MKNFKNWSNSDREIYCLIMRNYETLNFIIAHNFSSLLRTNERDILFLNEEAEFYLEEFMDWKNEE